MKDWLSLAFQLKKQAVACQWTAAEAKRRLQPLLSSLALSECVSEGCFMALLLANYMQHMDSSKRDAVTVAKCIPEADEEMGESLKLKSGALDKVGDDCLKLALGYLGFKDRCNAVERSCHRLFALSRAVAIQCEDFADVWNQDMDTLKVARRFHTRTLTLIPDEHFFGGYVSENPSLLKPIISQFREQIVELNAYGDFCSEIGDVVFPKLKNASLSYAPQILANNPTITELFTEIHNVNGRFLLKCVADCKSLRKLLLKGVSYQNAYGRFDTSDLDLSHITELCVEGNCSFLPSVLHKDLERLTVDGYSHKKLRCKGKKPAALRSLDLMGFDVMNHRSLDRHNYADVRFLAPCKLDTLKVKAPLQKLAQIYDDYAPKHLDVYMHRTAVGVAMDECMHRLLPALTGGGRAETLELYFVSLSGLSHSAEVVRNLFDWLSQVSGILTARIQVRIAEKLWLETTKHMKPYFMKALKACITLKFHGVL